MRDKLITFETAKLAKEKSFDDYTYNCSNAYNLQGELGNYYDIVGESPFEEYDIDFDKLRYAAPTQTSLQRWLRERHDIHIEVNKEKKNLFFSFENNDIGKKLLTQGSSFEEALESGLIEGLKLIK